MCFYSFGVNATDVDADVDLGDAVRVLVCGDGARGGWRAGEGWGLGGFRVGKAGDGDG